MTADSLLPGHAKSAAQHARDICVAGRWMYQRGFIVACEGNLSVRLGDGRILTTPTCMNKGTLSPEDLVMTDLEGRQLQVFELAGLQALDSKPLPRAFDFQAAALRFRPGARTG